MMLLLLLASAAAAAPNPSYVLHERHAPHWGNHWAKRAAVPGDTIMPMRISLKQSRDVLARGHDILMDISSPESPNFRKHMSAQEVIDFFAPSNETVDAVMTWLSAAGVEDITLSENKQWLHFDASVSAAEDLFMTEYSLWEHASGLDISCEEYHLPRHIQPHVDFVLPGVRMIPGKIKKANPPQKRHTLATAAAYPGFPKVNSSSCNAYVTPACIKNQYGIPNGTTSRTNNSLGIYASDNEHYSMPDLNAFWPNLWPVIPTGTKPTDDLIDGAVSPANPSASPYDVPIGQGEADLDIEVAWPIIWPQKITVFQVDDQYYEQTESSGFGAPAGSFNTFLDALDSSYCTYSAYGETGDCTYDSCTDPVYPDNPANPINNYPQYKGQRQCGAFKPTNVISISYSLPESALPAFYMERQCNEWMKLGMQGVTVVVATGDHGVGNDGECNGFSQNIFEPFYIATCPYVLAVGATELDTPAGQKPQPNQHLAERAPLWEVPCPLSGCPPVRAGSGSGFSNVFAQPSYQKSAVASYLSKASLSFSSYSQFVNYSDFSNVTSGVFNKLGRAYPDVSAVGSDILITDNGVWTLANGTSAATPIWAGILTLINEARLAAGKATLGFINPTLYSNPQVFNDITSGNSVGCNTDGFPAAVGWDAATGLGSPNYTALYKLLTA